MGTWDVAAFIGNWGLRPCTYKWTTSLAPM